MVSGQFLDTFCGKAARTGLFDYGTNVNKVRQPKLPVSVRTEPCSWTRRWPNREERLWMRKPRTLDEDSPADRALNYAVGKRIRELRQDKNMTQKQLSELSDIKATYITLIEATGVNLSLKLLQRLADALGVTPRDLLPARDQGETPSVTIEIVRKKVADLAEQVRNLEAVVAKPKH